MAQINPHDPRTWNVSVRICVCALEKPHVTVAGTKKRHLPDYLHDSPRLYEIFKNLCVLPGPVFLRDEGVLLPRRLAHRGVLLRAERCGRCDSPRRLAAGKPSPPDIARLCNTSKAGEPPAFCANARSIPAGTVGEIPGKSRGPIFRSWLLIRVCHIQQGCNATPVQIGTVQ